jgi:5-methylcytosine-specific restriction endonuclease McrA
MASIYNEDVINKKTALDKVMNSTSISGKRVKDIKEQCIRTLNRLKIMFPNLKTIRLCQLSDFYTLAVLVWKFENSSFILTDKKRNRLAFDLLRNFSNGVDETRALQRKARGIRPGQELYREYLLTVYQSTDEIKQRQKREEILRSVLESLYERKDKNRIYSREQRRLIWNSEDEPKCAICGKAVTWGDYTADHVKPHSKGGKTVISNAALTHRVCNSKKGNRK